MASLPEIKPNGYLSQSGSAWTYSTVGYYQDIDEGYSAYNDADYIQEAQNGNGSIWFDLDAMPSDFGSMDTLTISMRCGLTGSRQNDDYIIYAQVYRSDGTTALTAERQVAQLYSTNFSSYSGLAFSSLDTGAGKTIWDGARIRIRAYWAQSGQPDAASIQIAAFSLFGTYTTSGGGSVKQGSLSASAAATLTLDGGAYRRRTFAPSAAATLALTGKRIRHGALTPAASAALTLTGAKWYPLDDDAFDSAAFHSGVPSTTKYGALSPSASATLTLSGGARRRGTLALTASGSLSLSGRATRQRPLSLGGAATLALSGGAYRRRTLAPSATATLSLSGKAIRHRALPLSGTAAIAFAGGAVRRGVLTLSASASLSLTGGETPEAGTLALVASASLSLAGGAYRRRALALSGSATLALVGQKQSAAKQGTLAVSSSAALTLDGQKTARRPLVVSASASLTLSGKAIRHRALALPGSATLALDGGAIRRGTLSLSASATLGLTGSETPEAGSLALSGTAQLTLSGGAYRRRSLAPAATATLVLAGGAYRRRALALTGTASLALTGHKITGQSIAFTAGATLTLSGNKTARGTLALTAGATMILDGREVSEGAPFDPKAFDSPAFWVAPEGEDLDLSAAASLTLSGGAYRRRTLSPAASASLTLVGRAIRRTTLPVSASASLVLSGGAIRRRALALSGSATLALTGQKTATMKKYGELHLKATAKMLQPIVPGAILHLNAKMADGFSPGDGDLDEWFDLSGADRHGTLVAVDDELVARPRTNVETDRAVWHELAGGGRGASGVDIDGTLTDFTYSSGSEWVGDGSGGSPYALDFNGSNNYVAIAKAGLPDLAKAKIYTYDTWFICPPAGTTRCVFSEAQNDAYWFYTSVQVMNTGYLRTTYFWGEGLATHVLSPSTLTPGQLYHVTATADGTTLKLYLDGAYLGQGDISTLTPITPVYATIGAMRVSYLGAPFLGEISRVLLYNRALGSTEVAANHANGIAGAYPVRSGLVADFDASRACRASGWNEEDALQFDGHDDAVSIPFVDLATSRHASLECWFSTREAYPTANSYRRLISSYNAAYYEFGMWLANGRVYGYHHPDDGAGYHTLNTATVNDGALHHAVFVWDGDVSTLYIDGVAGTPRDTSGVVFSTQQLTTLALGRYASPTGQRFIGEMYAARIYPFALTPDDVLTNYEAGVEVSKDYVRYRHGSLAIEATAAMAALGRAYRHGTLALSASASLEISPQVKRMGELQVSASSTLSLTGVKYTAIDITGGALDREVSRSRLSMNRVRPLNVQRDRQDVKRR